MQYASKSVSISSYRVYGNHSWVNVYALYCALISSEGVRYSLVFNGYYRENYEKQYFASTLYQI